MKAEVHPLFDLGGRVALVTGGGSGLGYEFCDILAEFGADVICADLYVERARETCGVIKKYGHEAFAIEVDVSQNNQVQSMFKQIIDRFDRLDILVNNAGIAPHYAVIDQIDIEDWHRVLNVNLHGVFYCMRESLRIMMNQKRGSIINISSICGFCAVDPDILAQAPYVASKAAVIGITRQAAVEYAQHGIRVNCIAPGWHHGTRLPESAGIKPTEEEIKSFGQMIASKTPMRRTGDPRELKGLLLYLASDSSSFVTGQTIVHDGGWTCL